LNTHTLSPVALEMTYWSVEILFSHAEVVNKPLNKGAGSKARAAAKAD